jgi:nitrous oxidase accessory protein NosD
VHELGCLAGPAVGTGVLRCAYRCRAVVARSLWRAPAGRLVTGSGTTTRGRLRHAPGPARCPEPGSWRAGWWTAPSRRGCLHP